MPHQDINILNSLYKNANWATESINMLIPKVRNPQLKREMKYQRNHYHAVCENIRNEIYRINGEPLTANPAYKLWSDISLSLSSKIKPTTTHIAEKMIRGTTAGMIDIIKALNCYTSIDTKLKKQAENILQREQDFIDNLKKYL